jgi:hypothetical protein
MAPDLSGTTDTLTDFRIKMFVVLLSVSNHVAIILHSSREHPANIQQISPLFSKNRAGKKAEQHYATGIENKILHGQITVICKVLAHFYKVCVF